MTAKEATAAILNRDTLLPVSSVIGIVALVATAVIGFARIEARLSRIEDALNGGWSRASQVEWALRLQVGNPSLRIPEVVAQPAPKSSTTPN